MQKPIGTVCKTFPVNVRPVLAALILIVYVSGSMVVDFAHHSIHNHNKQAFHSDKLEQDPCHRSTHHHDKEKGCNHQVHLTMTDTAKCMYSHLVFQADSLIVSRTSIELQFKDYLLLSFYQFRDSKPDCFAQSLRGPPVS